MEGLGITNSRIPSAAHCSLAGAWLIRDAVRAVLRGRAPLGIGGSGSGALIIGNRVRLTLRLKMAQKPFVMWSLGPKALTYESLEP